MPSGLARLGEEKNHVGVCLSFLFFNDIFPQTVCLTHGVLRVRVKGRAVDRRIAW